MNYILYIYMNVSRWKWTYKESAARVSNNQRLGIIKNLKMAWNKYENCIVRDFTQKAYNELTKMSLWKEFMESRCTFQVHTNSINYAPKRHDYISFAYIYALLIMPPGSKYTGDI